MSTDVYHIDGTTTTINNQGVTFKSGGNKEYTKQYDPQKLNDELITSVNASVSGEFKDWD